VRELEFGISIVPTAADLGRTRAAVQAAEAGGLSLVGIQDHPYQRRFLDTWLLIATLLAETERLRFFPDVANLPLRPPAMIAKAAATLDVLSGGRFELGIGAGGFWDAIAAMGGPRRTPGESVEALGEAIEILRLAWDADDAVSYNGRHYQVQGWKPGPRPAHRIEIWVGAYGPRMLGLTGRLADGWLPSMAHMPPERVLEGQARVDAGAREAGRDPAAIRRLYNLSGTITDGERGERPLDGPVEQWAQMLGGFATELRIDTFIFWPDDDDDAQVERFAAEVVPEVRRVVAESVRSGARGA
jgi:alkanesulfonate monooxygenase SsuD/methylene tetrahydromethanopterin reductase-like flavin-dependent oxidoreductase (luciferase family)